MEKYILIVQNLKEIDDGFILINNKYVTINNGEKIGDIIIYYYFENYFDKVLIQGKKEIIKWLDQDLINTKQKSILQ